MCGLGLRPRMNASPVCDAQRQCRYGGICGLHAIYQLNHYLFIANDCTVSSHTHTAYGTICWTPSDARGCFSLASATDAGDDDTGADGGFEGSSGQERK